MPARAPLRRRRNPGSDEGRRIVSSIVEAAERLLKLDSFANLSTNRIAEAAGVSVGSLYQYFPNKESIVAELARAMDLRALSLLQARAGQISAASAREAVHAFVDILLDARMGSLNLRRQLLEQVPRHWFMEESTRVDIEVQGFVCAFLRARSAEVDAGNPELATFVLFHAVESVVEAAVAGRVASIEDGSLRRELVRLVLRYLGLHEVKRRSSAPPELRLPS
jgi:AcrR family transcriptional regulator